MRLELERGLLEYDKLDIANQLAGAEFLKLVDCVKDVGEANKVSVTCKHHDLCVFISYW